MNDDEKKSILESEGYLLGFGRYTYEWLPPFETPLAIKGSDNENDALENAWEYREHINKYKALSDKYDKARVNIYLLVHRYDNYEDSKDEIVVAALKIDALKKYAELHFERMKLSWQLNALKTNRLSDFNDTLKWKSVLPDDEYLCEASINDDGNYYVVYRIEIMLEDETGKNRDNLYKSLF